jgi:hypothetical protein
MVAAQAALRDGQSSYDERSSVNRAHNCQTVTATYHVNGVLRWEQFDKGQEEPAKPSSIN